MRLNPQQQAAVRWVDGPLLVLAGAGSGKTSVITHKIAHLIGGLDYLPEKIAAITFTNKAAREMQGRVSALLGSVAEGLTVSTFHALGLRFLHAEASRLGYRAGFSIFDTEDVAKLLKEILPEGLSREGIMLAAWQIGRWKAEGLLPEEVEPGDDAEARAAEAYRAYAERMARFNAFDFDDLILRPARLLELDDEVREKWQQRFRHILVDEYQDTNAIQYRLLNNLLGSRMGLTAVGDDDQSIYGWRGAQPENLAQLARDYPTLKVIKLEQNYRSVRSVLKAANALISHNPHDFEKRLWSDLGEGDPIRIVECAGDDDEIEKLVGAIQYRRFTAKNGWSDFAVLYRSNHQARRIEQAFRAHQMPYQLSGGASFFDRVEIKDLLAYVRLIANPRDDGAFLRVINTPRRELGAASVEDIAEHARRHGVPLLVAAAEPSCRDRLAPRGRSALGRFLADYERWRRAADEPLSLLDQLVEDIDYAAWLRRQAKDRAQAERRLQGLADLCRWWTKLARSEAGRDLQNLVQMTALLGPDDDSEDADGIRLMTLHSAKGLEFPHVYIIGVEEGLLPHQSSLDDGTVAEERRLMYVGITRAQRTLTLSYASRRRRYGEIERRDPSRFLDELPQDLVRREGDDPEADADESRKRARAHLDNIKAMFD